MRKRKNYLRFNTHILRIVKNNIEAYEKDEANRTVLKRLVLWLGRELVWENEHRDYYDTETIFNVSKLYEMMVAKLTYKEFLEIYPIEKRYDGSKIGTRDYYSTKDYLSTIDLNSTIDNKENVMDLFWDYSNWELLDIASASMSATSYLGEELLGINISEAFFTKEEGYAHDSKGNIVGVTTDGRTHKILSFWNNKKYQTNLRVIK